MTAEPTTFVVTDNPPWYQDAHRDDRPFACDHPEGLLDQVARVMNEKTATAAAKCKAFQHKTVRKLVRDMVIEDIHVFKQNPSKPLLLALMDLVDIQGGELECMSTEDRAGMKQLMVALRNYTLFYIPNKALKSAADNRIVIPVVTLWDHTNAELELRFCDEARSMLATYKVNLSRGSPAYFMQQVLAAPSVQSLRVLEAVAGDRYRFWDMSLEVPTHADALTPFFKQIQPSRLLRVEDKKRSSSAQDGSGDQDSDEEVEPMCCVLDKESAALQSSKRQGSVDCFSEADVICDLSRFTCEPPVAKTVYFRRTGRVLGQKRGNMIAVVSLRESQRNKQRLYVSTTARFCRALKYSCVKGSGELLKCCHTTINELACRDTFLTGSELHQEILHPAITAFAKRVSSPATNWCSYTPKHVACLIKNPIMNEIVDMGIKLMDAKIPNALMVAELLLSSTKTANGHLQARARYAEDASCRIQICKKNIANLEKQFRVDLDTLIRRVSKITTDKAHKNAIRDLFRNLNTMNINDTFKQWQQMIKDSPQTSKDNALVKEHINTKVHFHNLRVYLSKKNRLKKIIKTQQGAEEEEEEDAAATSTSTSTSGTDTIGKSSGYPVPNRSPQSEADLTLAQDSPSQKPWYLSMIVPDNPHLGTWVRNMGTLLQSAPWLHADVTKREAVCSVLGLSKNAVCNKYASVLKQWTCNNLTTVEQLKHQGLEDTLSAALIRIRDDMSHESWMRNVERAFILKTEKCDNTAGSGKKKSKRERKADRNPAKPSKKKTARRDVVKELFCQEECEEDTGELSEPDEDEEYVCRGEDLLRNEDYDTKELSGEYDASDDENLDEYDLDDDFIDDRSEYSVEESEQEAPRPVKSHKRTRRRLVEGTDSETDSDREDSDDKPVPGRITKRRITKQHDDADCGAEINVRKKASAKSERNVTKSRKERFGRTGSKGYPREKSTLVRSSATKKRGGQKSKVTQQGSGDRKRRRICSDSDSSQEDYPVAKRSSPTRKQQTPPKPPVVKEHKPAVDYPEEGPASPATASSSDPDEDTSDFF